MRLTLTWLVAIASFTLMTTAVTADNATLAQMGLTPAQGLDFFKKCEDRLKDPAAAVGIVGDILSVDLAGLAADVAQSIRDQAGQQSCCVFLDDGGAKQKCGSEPPPGVHRHPVDQPKK